MFWINTALTNSVRQIFRNVKFTHILIGQNKRKTQDITKLCNICTIYACIVFYALSVNIKALAGVTASNVTNGQQQGVGRTLSLSGRAIKPSGPRESRRIQRESA